MKKLFKKIDRLIFPLLAGIGLYYMVKTAEEIYRVARGPLTPEETDAMMVHNDTTGIGALRADFARTDLGKMYLAFNDSTKTSIVFNDPLCKAIHAEGCYIPHKNIIILRSGDDRPKHLETLAHESKHKFNATALSGKNFYCSLLPPSRIFAYKRIEEADAWAAGAYYIADRGILLGDSAELNDALLSAPVVRALQKEMVKGDLSQQAFRDAALIPMLKNVAELYDQHQIESEGAMNKLESLKQDTAGSEKFIETFKILERMTPDEAAYEAGLRELGRPIPSTDKPSALSNPAEVSLIRMTELYPYEAEEGYDLKTFKDMKREDEENLATLNDGLRKLRTGRALKGYMP